jgi:hypothetical protein
MLARYKVLIGFVITSLIFCGILFLNQKRIGITPTVIENLEKSSFSSVQYSSSIQINPKLSENINVDFRNMDESDRLYYTGTLGDNSPIVLKIGKHALHHSKLNSHFAEYIYVGVGENSINLEGNLINGVFEFLEKPNAVIKINPETKTGSWDDGKNNYPISLEEFVVDPAEPNKNPIEVRLLKKNKVVKTDYFDLYCETSGKINVGGCGLINKKGVQITYIKSIGFPKILNANKEFTVLEFSYDGYGVCAYHKYRINNSDLTFNELESYNGEDCKKKYFESNPIPNS